ncbi:MAG: ABC transporter ATP-binding protein [Deltaproteobacteria bacterium]
MGIVEGEKVTKFFGGLAAVYDVDFDIKEGEIVGLIGPNGAGKTTLFNLISGSLSTTGGEIKFQGKTITKLKPHQICRLGIARTFQSVKLFGNLSVLDHVFLGSICGTASRTKTIDAQHKAAALLDLVGLSARNSELAKNLPLAEQKRLEVARALATEPRVLLLDEVMAGLTATEVNSFTTLIHQIRSGGTTILLVEHVMQAIMAICDRIIVLHHGVKLAEGLPQEIAKNQKVIEVYLGTDAYAER